MAQYVCTEKCWHNGKLWRKGDLARFSYNFPKGKDGKIRHFELVGKGDDITPPSGVTVKVNDKEVKP